MNEVTRIHLGRTTYEIDVEAKKDLEKYITAIKRSLDDAEIIDDVELRMTEILADRGVGRDGVITASDVTAIRATLGEPRDFADDEKDSENWRDNLFTRGRSSGSAYRKYYRDEDSAILGGVAAGLSAYAGWDLTLVRVAFVAAGILSVGWAVLIYIVIWIITPAARTISEKLEMRGEPVTLQSLKNSDFAKESRKNAQAFADDVKEKVADIKAKHGKARGDVDSDEAETAGVKTCAADARAEDRRAFRDYHRQDSTRPASIIAAIVGVIFTCIGFAVLMSTMAFAITAIIVLINNSFAQEIWLWLAAGASIVAGLTFVGFFMSIGQALMNRSRRAHSASGIAGTLGATIMFSFIASIFIGIWLFSIPRDYHLPNNIVNIVQRFDSDICQVKIGSHDIQISRQCD